MKDYPTLEEVNDVLDEVEQLMSSTSDGEALLRLSAVYAAAYSFKLRLTSKENPHADR